MMKFKVGQRVRIVRGLFAGSKGTVTEVDKRYSSPYRVRVDGKPHISGGSGQERLTARDLR
jgi:ribosomal protein L24